eukprot:11608729-Alexandrium_andersonii.AAC.1
MEDQWNLEHLRNEWKAWASSEQDWQQALSQGPEAAWTVWSADAERALQAAGALEQTAERPGGSPAHAVPAGSEAFPGVSREEAAWRRAVRRARQASD